MHCLKLERELDDVYSNVSLTSNSVWKINTADIKWIFEGLGKRYGIERIACVQAIGLGGLNQILFGKR